MRRLLTAILLTPMVLGPLTGCYRPLFDEHLPRHQYESYDTARHGNVPTEEYDLFGNPQPTLKARLVDR